MRVWRSTRSAKFRELREDDFAGGFVVRRFEKFSSAEARTWWAGGTSSRRLDGRGYRMSADVTAPQWMHSQITAAEYESWSAATGIPVVYSYLLDSASRLYRESEVFTGLVKATVPFPVEIDLTLP